MGMFYTNYSTKNETGVRSARYHYYDESDIITEKTEDLPELISGNDMKRSFKEAGGNAYVKSGVLMQSSEFTILGSSTDEAGRAITLSFKNYNGVPGLYRITEDGAHEKII